MRFFLCLLFLILGGCSAGATASPQNTATNNTTTTTSTVTITPVDNKLIWAAMRAESQVQRVWNTYMTVKTVQHIKVNGSDTDMGKVVLSLCDPNTTMVEEDSCENGNAISAFVSPYRDIPAGTKVQVFKVSFMQSPGEWTTIYLVQ